MPDWGSFAWRARRSVFHHLELILGTILLAAVVVLGTIGYGQLRGPYVVWSLRDLSDALYQTVMLLSLNPSQQYDVPVALDVARWLSLLLVGYILYKAYLAIVHQRFLTLRIRGLDEYITICGLNRKSAILANDLLGGKGARGEGPKVPVVVIIESDPANPLIAEYKEKGAMVLIGQPTDPVFFARTRPERATHVFIMGDNDEENVQVALNLYELLYQKINRRTTGKIVNCFVHLSSPSLQALFRDHPVFRDNFDFLNARIFSVHDIASAKVLRAFSPDSVGGGLCHLEDGPPVQIMIIGAGNMGMSLLRRSVVLCHYASRKKPIITLIDKEATRHLSRMKTFHPAVDDLAQIRAYDCDATTFGRDELAEQYERGCPLAVYVCLDDDAESYLAGSRLASIISDDIGLDPSLFMIVVCMPENTSIPPALLTPYPVRGYGHTADSRQSKETRSTFIPYRILGYAQDIELFHTVSETCSWVDIVAPELDDLARHLHEQYVASLSEEKRARLAARDWAILDEGYRDSNRLKADFMCIRCRALAVRKRGLADDWHQNEALTEMLACMEHTRWLAEKALTGWRYGPLETFENRKNPNIVPWELLPQEVRAYNISDALAFMSQVLQCEGETPCPLADPEHRTNPRSFDRTSCYFL